MRSEMKRVSKCSAGKSSGVGVKKQSCSEWPETHFGLGFFEIL